MFTYTYTIIAGARLVPLTFTITTAEMATVMSGQECRSPFKTKDVASVLAKNVISRKTWILQNSFFLLLELFSRIQSELFCCLEYLSTCWSDWLKCFDHFDDFPAKRCSHVWVRWSTGALQLRAGNLTHQPTALVLSYEWEEKGHYSSFNIFWNKGRDLGNKLKSSFPGCQRRKLNGCWDALN